MRDHKSVSAYLSVLVASTVNVSLAGPLTPPPGPVAPTHKTLTQVEPRTPINATNTPGDAASSFIISQPGSYYLTGNILAESGKEGIRIQANNVTLDLEGFSLIGNNLGTKGISMPNFRLGVVIRNGIVSEWASDGIAAMIDAGRIERVTAINNGANGIVNSAGSFTTHIIGCEVVGNLQNGIVTGGDTLVRECVVTLNGGGGQPGTAGIVANDRSIVENCSVTSFTADAVLLGNNAIVRDCRLSANAIGAAAIRSGGTRNRIENNSISASNIGLAITGQGNFIRDNFVTGATDAYQFSLGNSLHLLLSQLPESIDWPANVTIAGNLSMSFAGPGITIASNDVVIDLNGFAISGNGAQALNSDGITVSGARSNIVIRNGALRSWGDCGVDLTSGRGMTLERLDATNNLGDGIRTGAETFVRSCRASNNSVNGISVGSLSRIEESMAHTNGLHGFSIGGATSIVRCDANSNGTAAGTTGAGFFVPGAAVNGRIEECHAASNDAGFDIDGAGWLITRNVGRSNGLNNFLISAGNNSGFVVGSPAGAGANDNISY